MKTFSERSFLGSFGFLALGFVLCLGACSKKAQLEFCRAEAENGDTVAMTRLGWELSKDEVPAERDKGREYLQKAANAGNAHAMYFMGLNYHEGDHGFAKDDAMAREYFLKAAKLGHRRAQYAMGLSYQHKDWGGDKDYAKAHYWYEKAALQGNRYAWGQLGVMYHNGQGTPVDLEKAMELWRKGATLGDAQSMAWIAHFYMLRHPPERFQGKAEPVALDQAEGQRWVDKAYAKAEADQDKETLHWLNEEHIWMGR